MPKNKIILDLEKYNDKGLYIVINNALIKLTEEVIRESAKSFWHDSSKIPDDVKENVKFKRCAHCPKKQGLCDTLKVILPFLTYIDQFKSFDKVISIYKGDINHLYHVDDTTLQDALKYSAILALTQYCVFGENFKKYFQGLIPTMTPNEIAEKVFLNAYFIHKGNTQAINKLIDEMNQGLTISVTRLNERIRLLCKNDVFLNAFVGTQIVTEYLSMDIIENMSNYFEENE